MTAGVGGPRRISPICNVALTAAQLRALRLGASRLPVLEIICGNDPLPAQSGHPPEVLTREQVYGRVARTSERSLSGLILSI
jgi:hypothetical protein